MKNRLSAVFLSDFICTSGSVQQPVRHTDCCRGYYDSKIYRFFWKLSGEKLGNVLLKRQSRLMLMNYFQNPAHKELWENVLKQYGKRENLDE